MTTAATLVRVGAHATTIVSTAAVGPRGPKGDPGDSITDHGDLDGLADDDHPQYLTTGRGDARYEPVGAVAGEATARDAAIETHRADTTNVHGIADTSLLATQAYVLARVADLVNTSPAELDTFLEVYNRFLTDESAATALATTVAGKQASHADLTALSGVGVQAYGKALLALASGAAFTTLLRGLLDGTYLPLRQEGTTLGASSIVAGSLVTDIDTHWGIHLGVPYYETDPADVTAGEEAIMDVDETGAVSWVLLSDVAAKDTAVEVETARALAAEVLLAPKASPTFTGTPAAPTAAPGTNTTQLANTAFVAAAVAALVNSAPGILDTLGEIATALQADESTAAALAATVAGKLAKASNLSDLTSAATALTNLGLTANGSSLVTAANYAAMRTLLGVDVHETIRWLTAQAWQSSAGAPTLSGATLGSGGKRTGAWLLDATTEESVGATLMIPSHWSNIKVEAYWTNVGGGVGDVVLAFDYGLLTDGSTVDVESSPGNVTTTALATNILKKTTLTASLAITPGGIYRMDIRRVAADAADTLANDAGIVGVAITKV